ncbi:response regulator transcription factor [Pigmentiphaga litoralis]|uniref:response regulator transcription factor n=1 Tax=Pigmentiphaga litoralis TaxID=516702 RepID=UPI0016767D8A|nr:response regulator transcription factor [Pigmentiphaga litoralis]
MAELRLSYRHFICKEEAYMVDIIITESHPVLQRGLQQILTEVDPTWVPIPRSTTDLRHAQAYAGADMILFSLPNEPDALARDVAIAASIPQPNILFLSPDPILVTPMLPAASNVRGCVDSGASVEVLVASIRLVRVGGRCFPAVQQPVPPGLTSRLVKPLDPPGQQQNADMELLGITARQYEVLVALARGHSIQAVGELLNISISTAKSHAYALYRRLGVNSKSEAVYEASRRGASFDWDTPTVAATPDVFRYVSPGSGSDTPCNAVTQDEDFEFDSAPPDLVRWWPTGK